MTETKPKTLRDYLLDGGVRGRYFRNDVEPTIDNMPYGGYSVEGIITGHGVKHSVDLFARGIGTRDGDLCATYLSGHLNDPELTNEEVSELRNSFDERYAKWMSRSDKPVTPLS